MPKARQEFGPAQQGEKFLTTLEPPTAAITMQLRINFNMEKCQMEVATNEKLSEPEG